MREGFRPTDSANPGISRRDFLGNTLRTATLLVPVSYAGSVKEQVRPAKTIEEITADVSMNNCRRSDCATLPDLSISDEQRHALLGTLDPLRALMRPGALPFDVVLKKGETPYIGGVAMYNPSPRIYVVLPNTDPQILSAGQEAISHEGVHMLNNSLLHAPVSTFASLVKELIGEGKVNPKIYRAVTEGTYAKIKAEKRFGHPQDNSDEFFTSTVNVLRFHFDGFLDTMRKLRKAEDPKADTLYLVAQAAVRSLMQTTDAQKEAFKLLFDPHLFEYLGVSI